MAPEYFRASAVRRYTGGRISWAAEGAAVCEAPNSSSSVVLMKFYWKKWEHKVGGGSKALIRLASTA